MVLIGESLLVGKKALQRYQLEVYIKEFFFARRYSSNLDSNVKDGYVCLGPVS